MRIWGRRILDKTEGKPISNFPSACAFPFSLSPPFSLPFFFFLARDLSVDDVPFSSFDLSEPVLFYFIILLSRNFFRRSVTFSFSFPLSFVLLVPLTLLFYSLSL